MSDEEEYSLSSVGWQVVEIIERMVTLRFTLPDICAAVGLTEEHLRELLKIANDERNWIERGLNELSE